MGFCASELRDYVIRPTLQRLGTWTPSWENLLLGTIAQCSQFCFHTHNGRGLGLYQIDKETHRSVWDHFLAFDPDLASLVRGFASQREFLNEPEGELITNLAYATVIAWAIYLANAVALPDDANDAQALANCWFQHFPRHNAAYTPSDFVTNFHKHVAPKLARVAA